MKKTILFFTFRFCCVPAAVGAATAASTEIDREELEKDIGAFKKTLLRLRLTPEDSLSSELDALPTTNQANTAAWQTRIRKPGNPCSIPTCALFKLPTEWDTYPDFTLLVQAKKEAINQLSNQRSTLNQLKTKYRTAPEVTAFEAHLTQTKDAIADYFSSLGVNTPQFEDALAADHQSFTKALAPFLNAPGLLAFLQTQAAATLEGRILPLTDYTPAMTLDALKKMVAKPLFDTDATHIKKQIDLITSALQAAQELINKSTCPLPVQTIWCTTLADYFETFIASGITIAHARLCATTVTTICTKAEKELTEEELTEEDSADEQEKIGQKMEADIKDMVATITGWVATVPELKPTTEVTAMCAALGRVYTTYAKAKKQRYDHNALMQKLGLAAEAATAVKPGEDDKVIEVGPGPHSINLATGTATPMT